MKLGFPLGSTLVLGVIRVSCGEEPAEDCVAACETAEMCGLLPSILGAGDGADARESCVNQCRASGPSRRNRVTQCLRQDAETHGPDGAEDDVDLRDSWCSRGECQKAATCLWEAFNEPKILGTGELEIDFVLGDGDASTQAKGDLCGATRLRRENGPECAPLDADCGMEDGLEAFCECIGATEAQVFVEHVGGRRAPAPVSCVQALVGATVSGLVPGLVQPGLKLRGARYPAEEPEPGADGTTVEPEPWCIVVWGAGEVVPASDFTTGTDRTEATFALPPGDVEALRLCPSAFSCEDTLERCSNGEDDDGDAKTDCDDDECAEFCETVETDSGDAQDPTHDDTGELDPQDDGEGGSTTGGESGADTTGVGTMGSAATSSGDGTGS